VSLWLQGGYHFDLLSVDCPAEKEGHHRIFLAGNSASYARVMNPPLVAFNRPCLCTNLPYRCPADNAKSLKLEITDAFGEFHTDLNDDYSGVNKINASHYDYDYDYDDYDYDYDDGYYYYYFRFLLSDAHPCMSCN
jgi:hypothetical protein